MRCRWGLGTPLRFMCGPDVKLRGNGPVWQERGGTGEARMGCRAGGVEGGTVRLTHSVTDTGPLN